VPSPTGHPLAHWTKLVSRCCAFAFALFQISYHSSYCSDRKNSFNTDSLLYTAAQKSNWKNHRKNWPTVRPALVALDCTSATANWNFLKQLLSGF
jgi:hypothetical protein